MEKDEIDTSYYNGIAVPERPIIIDNIPIYGVLYNQAEEELLKMKNMGDIVEYVSYLVATEQFIKMVALFQTTVKFGSCLMEYILLPIMQH